MTVDVQVQSRKILPQAEGTDLVLRPYETAHDVVRVAVHGAPDP